MEDIFKNINSAISNNSIDKNVLKSYLSPETAKKLSFKFINAISESHDYVPQFNIHVSTRTILVNNDDLYLELEMLEPRHDNKIFVRNNNCSQAVGVLKGEAKLSICSSSTEKENHVALTEQKQLKARDVSLLERSYYIIDNPTQAPLLLLYLTNKKSISRGSSVPAYRIDSGKFSHFVSSKLSSSRLETMLSIMADMGYSDCSDIVKNLASTHHDYFVRWESIRTYLRLNPDSAVPFLEKVMKSEDHPHVLNAAKKSLDLIKRNLADAS